MRLRRKVKLYPIKLPVLAFIQQKTKFLCFDINKGGRIQKRGFYENKPPEEEELCI